MRRRRWRWLGSLVAVVLVVSSGSFLTTAAPAPDATGGQPATSEAREVINALVAAGLPAVNIAAQSAASDPNRLLGTPGAYTSRASADLAGGDKRAEKFSIFRGLVVEVFYTAELADQRARYITGFLGSSRAWSEHLFRARDGRALLRLVGTVRTEVVEQCEILVASL